MHKHDAEYFWHFWTKIPRKIRRLTRQALVKFNAKMYISRRSAMFPVGGCMVTKGVWPTKKSASLTIPENFWQISTGPDLTRSSSRKWITESQISQSQSISYFFAISQRMCIQSSKTDTILYITLLLTNPGKIPRSNAARSDVPRSFAPAVKKPSYVKCPPSGCENQLSSFYTILQTNRQSDNILLGRHWRQIKQYARTKVAPAS